MSVIFLSLFALTFGLCGNAVAAPVVTSITANQTNTAVAAPIVANQTNTAVQGIKGFSDLAVSSMDCAGGNMFSCGSAVVIGYNMIPKVAIGEAAVAVITAVGEVAISATGGLLAGVASPAVIGGAVIVASTAAVVGAVWWYLK